MMWDLEKGLATVRFLEKALEKVGWHVALAGSVMSRGQSEKDLDVIVYPHNKGGIEQTDAVSAWASIIKILKAEDYGVCGGTSQIRDEKDVRWIQARGKRIDFFFLS